jgi:hypothetical protein
MSRKVLLSSVARLWGQGACLASLGARATLRVQGMQGVRLGCLARATETREGIQEEDAVHAPRIGRRIMALAEVQEVLVESAGRLRRRVALLIRRSPEPEQEEQDPVLAMLAGAPVDDEPVTDNDRRHIAEGWQAYREGRVVSSEEAKQACLDAKGDTGRREANPAIPV